MENIYLITIAEHEEAPKKSGLYKGFWDKNFQWL